MLIVVGLGANQGDVEAAFATAKQQLAQRLEVVAASSLWRTRAIGPEQPEFVNAALLLRVRQHPLELLRRCHELEAAAGRDRAAEVRWGPRPLDLDLLICDCCVAVAPSLCLPHPRLAVRRFALAPAAEIAPEWRHQRLGRTLADLACDASIAEQECAAIGAYPAA